MPRHVRTYTRTDPRTGRQVSVRHHSRRGKPRRKRGPNLQHAGKLGRRSVIHARKGRKGRAAMAAGVALAEVVCWFTLNGTAAIFALIAGILVFLSIVLSGRWDQ